jgi:hypothetical protein
MENNTVAPDLIDDKPDEVKSDLRKFNKAEDQVNKAMAALGAITKIEDKVGVDGAMEIMIKAKKLETIIETKRKDLVKPYNDEVKRINEYAKTLIGKIPPAIEKAKGLVLAFQQKEEKRLKDLRTNAREKQLIELGYTRYVEGTEHVKGDVYVNNDQHITRFSIENHSDEAWVLLLQTMAARLEEKKQQQIADLKLEKDVADFFGDTDDKQAIDQRISEIQNTPTVIPSASVPAFGPSKVKGLTKRWVFDVQDAGMIPREFLQVDEKKIRDAIAAGTRNIPGVRIYQDQSITLP